MVLILHKLALVAIALASISIARPLPFSSHPLGVPQVDQRYIRSLHPSLESGALGTRSLKAEVGAWAFNKGFNWLISKLENGQPLTSVEKERVREWLDMPAGPTRPWPWVYVFQDTYPNLPGANTYPRTPSTAAACDEAAAIIYTAKLWDRLGLTRPRGNRPPLRGGYLDPDEATIGSDSSRRGSMSSNSSGKTLVESNSGSPHVEQHGSPSSSASTGGTGEGSGHRRSSSSSDSHMNLSTSHGAPASALSRQSNGSHSSSSSDV